MLTTLNKFTLILVILISLFTAQVSANEKADKMPLFFYVFIHDDIPLHERDTLRQDYFTWLLKDLESFTGRRVYLELIQNSGPLTSFRYQGEDLYSMLDDWTKLVNVYRNSNNLPINIRSKYLLLTKSPINNHALGYAGFKYPTGVASLGSYPAAAHELGHMLGGVHEAAEVLFKNGWWCETNLVATRVPLRANCYHYSDENKKAIAAYLSESP
ncbi:MAG: hypothetical protein ACOH2R_03305 [Pseudomonas sp.]